MKNEVLLQKESSSFSNYWATSLNDAEIQLKKLCTHNNGNLYAYAANNPVRYVDPDGNAYTNKISNSKYEFWADSCVLDKAIDDLLCLIPYSSLSKKLNNITSDLNRIEKSSTSDLIKTVGNDISINIFEKSSHPELKGFAKIFNRINIVKTIYSTFKDLLNNEAIGREQFIQYEFSDVLTGISRENVERQYLYAKEMIDNFIDLGYVNLEIDKKGFLIKYSINNQEAIDMLYSNLRNLQLEINYGR